MKPASCSPRNWLILGFCALLGAPVTQAQEAKPNETRLPQQVIPTGEEDAKAEATPVTQAARSAVSAEAAETQRLEAELREMTSESDEGLVIEQQPDGSELVDLQGRFMSVAIATPNADGSYTVSCHTGEDAAGHAKHAHDIAAGTAPRAVKQDSAKSTTPTAPKALEEK